MTVQQPLAGKPAFGADAADAPAGKEARIAAHLDQMARLSAEVAQLAAGLNLEKAADVGSARDERAHAAIIKNVILARGRRGAYLPPELFAEPAWDILLDLFLAHVSQVRISVSSLCLASKVPTTTALRWLNTLEDHQLVERRDDPLDGRRRFIALTPKAHEALTRYFAALPGPLPVL